MKTPFFLPLAVVGTVVVMSLAPFAPWASAQSAESLQIEKRSTYQTPGMRSPFWPIGWSPSAAGPVVVTDDADVSFFKPELFSLTSISIGRVPLALINGRAYSEGDLVPINESHNAEVVGIRDGEADLRFRNKKITVRIKIQQARPPQGGQGGRSGRGR